MSVDDDIADELLLRDTIEVRLMVDVSTARNLDDETLQRVLGVRATEAVREYMDDE
jgi:hypothetical protein